MASECNFHGDTNDARHVSILHSLTHLGNHRNVTSQIETWRHCNNDVIFVSNRNMTSCTDRWVAMWRLSLCDVTHPKYDVMWSNKRLRYHGCRNKHLRTMVMCTWQVIWPMWDGLKNWTVAMRRTLAVILDSIVVSIPACHAGDRGSIPRRGDNTFWMVSHVRTVHKSIMGSICTRMSRCRKR